jgi:hypothetical protein
MFIIGIFIRLSSTFSSLVAHEQLHFLLGVFQGEDVCRDLLDGVSAGVDEPHRIHALGHLAQGAFQGQFLQDHLLHQQRDPLPGVWGSPGRENLPRGLARSKASFMPVAVPVHSTTTEAICRR